MTVCVCASLLATPRDDLILTIIVITVAVEAVAGVADRAPARGRAALPAGTAPPTTVDDPVPERHADLPNLSPRCAAQTSRASGTAQPSRESPDPHDVINGVQGLMRYHQFVRARALIHQQLEPLCAGDTPADPPTVVRATRTAVRCDPRGFDPATRAWAWRYYRHATRRHGPGHPMSVDAARRLVVILRAGGQAAQLAAFYREAGDDYDAFGMCGEALRVRISAAQVLHQMGRCATAQHQLDHSIRQWHDTTGAARGDVALVLAMLHLPIVCGHPRQARRMLRRLPALPAPRAAVPELLLGFHRGITDHRGNAGHRRVCTIAASSTDTVNERRLFFAELRAAVAGHPLVELVDDDYLGHAATRLSARERIAVRTGSVALRTSTLARKFHRGVAEVARIVHAAADTGQSRLIIARPRVHAGNRVSAKSSPHCACLGRSGTDADPQQVRPVLEDSR
ncbi:hypothetical protein [Actinoplanes sp. ATCC 53533]|uniref:hypothetical protein n=1 Tax=Actinoplanes sp. ATCC 53533 TaxID=1288362 RepID=UPI000F78873C|nr:hypothetical protein [Actinoplanes sp. ATCC 53533]